jgi:hypothetical protein
MIKSELDELGAHYDAAKWRHELFNTLLVYAGQLSIGVTPSASIAI